MAVSEEQPKNEEHETCCYQAYLVGGAGGHRPTNANVLRALRILKWWPAKIALTGQFVEVRRVETGQTALFGFIGIGLGAGLSIAYEAKHWSDEVCCQLNQCPTFDDFEGFGRLTLAEAAIAGGGSLSYLDFGSPTGCRLYFENNLGLIIGVGAEIGTYFGYYVRMS